MEYQFAKRMSNVKASAIREILKATSDPKMISFAGGNPSAEAFPVEEIEKISADILTNEPISVLQYGITEGDQELIKQATAFFNRHEQVMKADDQMMITSGSQQIMEFVAKILCNEGDVVICENPSFLGALNAFKSLGAVLRGIEYKNGQLDLESLKQALQMEPKPKFMYLIPNFQNPTGMTMSLEVRKEILKLIKGKKFVNDGGIYNDPRKRYFYSEFIKRLRIVIDDLKPNIIICASVDSTYIAQKACNYSVPVIMMCHMNTQIIVDEAKDYQMEAWKQADIVQTLLPSYAKIMKQAGAKNVITIPNTVPVINNDNLADLGKNKEIYKIITVGRVERVLKRTHLLVEAFGRIAVNYPNWHVDIYGEIDNKRYIKQIRGLISKYNIQEKVILHGKSDNVIAKLKESDIFAFPSKSEGFGLAMTEAMAVGLPVVAYKSCSGVNEIIVDAKNGFLAEDGIEDFASKLEKLMENKAN